MLEQIIEANDLLIKKIASSFYNASKEDLYQVGVIGVIKAYQNYEESMGVKFSTYAYRYIFGEMYHYTMNNKDIKISKEILKMFKIIENARCYLTQELKRLPSELEISEYLKLPIDTILMVIITVSDTISLDKEILDNEDGYNYVIDDSYKFMDDHILLNDTLDKLSDFENKLINYRYYLDMTQSETASKLGISQVKVSRYEKKLMKKLRVTIAS